MEFLGCDYTDYDNEIRFNRLWMTPIGGRSQTSGSLRKGWMSERLGCDRSVM